MQTHIHALHPLAVEEVDDVAPGEHAGAAIGGGGTTGATDEERGEQEQGEGHRTQHAPLVALVRLSGTPLA